MKYFLSLLIFFISLNSFAQNIPLRGNVKDKQGKGIPGAGVYVSGYKIATVTDPDGNFEFNVLKAGSYDILVEYIGFLPQKVSTTLENNPVTLKIELKESTTDIQGVSVIPIELRKKYLKLFEESFIGTTDNARQCKILNPEVLDVDINNKVLKVTSEDFLLIENQALGYRIKYLLKNFEYDFKTLVLYYEGYPTYEEMEGTENKLKKWQKSREEAYLGSKDHFFASLYNGTTTKEGFLINSVVKTPNTDRKPEALINAKIKAFSQHSRMSSIFVQKPNDSLAYWEDELKKPLYVSSVNQKVVLTDTLVHKYNNDIKYISFADDLYVIYTRGEESITYEEESGFWLERPANLKYFQISEITKLMPEIGFYKNGNVSNPNASRYSGFWAYKKVADQLPLDYKVVASGGEW